MAGLIVMAILPQGNVSQPNQAASIVTDFATFSRFTLERVLGHTENSVTSVYDRHHYRDEKRAALEVLAETLH